MKLIAIDTTSEHGSIALLEESDLLEEIELHSPDGFSPVLFGEIQALLARHGVGLPQIGAFAAASGPGSFTGVRVGLTAVKGLAEALNKPAFGISNLQALASFGSKPLRAVLIDARRGEVYGAVYDASLRLVQSEMVGSFTNWMSDLPPGDLEIVSRDFPVPLETAWPVSIASQPLAAAVGHIAFERVRKGDRSGPEQVDANYVRRSDAELFWRDTA